MFLGKTIRESGIRDKYHCMIAGVESEDGTLMIPDVNVPLEEGDTYVTFVYDRFGECIETRIELPEGGTQP